MVTNEVLDAFYWGTGSAPAGTQVGPWGAGQFFDIGFANGKPVNEGESVGRSAHATNYPGSPGDRAPHGGEVATAASPGRRNDLLAVYPSDLLSWAQSGVNEAVLQYGEMQTTPGRYSVTAATVASVAVSFPSSTQMQVDAVHSLTISDYGVAQVYTGSMRGLLTINPVAANLSYTLHLEGALRGAAGDSLVINHTAQFDGFAVGPRRMVYSTAIDWTRSGFDEWFHIQGTMTCARTGDNQWVWSDTRNATDYVDPTTKTCLATNTITRLSDGHLHALFDLTRPFPSGPTYPPSATDHLVIETDSTVRPDGTFNAQVLRFDDSLDGQPYVALQVGQTGQLGATQVNTPASINVTGTFTLPLQFVNGPAKTLECYTNASVTAANGKYQMSGVRGYRVDGNLWGEGQFTIDPPLLVLSPAPAPQGSTTTTTTTANGTTITVTTTVTVTVTVNTPSQPTPPPQPSTPTTGGSGHSLAGLGAVTVACVVAGTPIGAGTGGCTIPVVGAVPGAAAGAIIGGAVCGGCYLLHWIFF
ncbi:MAG TPA: hypothetical protein VK348_06225 [Planctomycetota bacterium]|nr:hypothetical protein [Planctomycetota bacterium]